MRYAVIDLNTFGVRDRNQETYLNFGDHIQVMAIEYLLCRMGISEKEIVRLSYYDLQNYRGEKLVMPVNWVVNLTPLSDGSLFSPDIVPVFLGVHFTVMPARQTLNWMKQWEPIGCRDEYTFKRLKECGIQVFLAGCITTLFPIKKNLSGGRKVYLIDVPQKIIQYVPFPEEICVRRSNVFVGLPDDLGESPELYVKNLYAQLVNEARLVVTSRLHVAIPCAAMGIPVILVCKGEKLPASMGWTEKLIPVYLESDFSKIDWNPPTPYFEEIKILKQHIAEFQLSMAGQRDSIVEDQKKLTSLFLNRSKLPIAEAWDEELIQKIPQTLLKNKCAYILWGKTRLAEIIYEYLCRHAPGAKLLAVIDTYQTGIFLEKPIVTPDRISSFPKEVHYIVTAFGATDIAKRFFQQAGIHSFTLWYPPQKKGE